MRWHLILAGILTQVAMTKSDHALEQILTIHVNAVSLVLNLVSLTCCASYTLPYLCLGTNYWILFFTADCCDAV